MIELLFLVTFKPLYFIELQPFNMSIIACRYWAWGI